MKKKPSQGRPFQALSLSQNISQPGQPLKKQRV
jgi:hypothetical protein